MKPTPEQEAFRQAAATCGIVVGQAGAGTGKTQTFNFIAEDMARAGRRAIYMTLNVNVAQDVGSRFGRGNVRSGTIHSLAHDIGQSTPGIREVIHRLEPGSTPLQPFHLGAYMGITGDFVYETGALSGSRELGFSPVIGKRTPDQIAGDAMSTIRNWCQSADPFIGIEHAFCPAGMTTETFDEVYGPYITGVARQVWDHDLTNPNGQIPFTHDHYLKMVSLLGPSFTQHLGLPAGSAIFFDEVQDARPAMLALIQAQTDMQLIAVGDSAQSIYGFTGAVDALPMLSTVPGSQTLPLTMSWRFGTAIADFANDILDLMDAEIRLEGNLAVDSSVEVYDRDDVHHPQATAVIVRDNRSLLAEARREMAAGRKVHIVADFDEHRDVIADVAEITVGRPGGRSAALRGVDTLEELGDAIELGGDSPALQTAGVAMRTNPTYLLDVLDNQVPADQADVTIITAHKSKGRQWQSVRLAMDPRHIIPGKTQFNKTVVRNGALAPETLENLRLFYVAATRAQERLFVPESIMDSYTTMRATARRALSGASLASAMLL